MAGTREENLARATTERLTAARVAEVAGCSLANAKIRIHRARRRLKDALEAECNFYRDEENVFRCDRKPESGVPLYRIVSLNTSTPSTEIEATR